MTSDEPTSRHSSATSVSTESNASDKTTRPVPTTTTRPKDNKDKERPAHASSGRRSSSKSSRRAAAPGKLKTDDHASFYKSVTIPSPSASLLLFLGRAPLPVIAVLGRLARDIGLGSLALQHNATGRGHLNARCQERTEKGALEAATSSHLAPPSSPSLALPILSHANPSRASLCRRRRRRLLVLILATPPTTSPIPLLSRPPANTD